MPGYRREPQHDAVAPVIAASALAARHRARTPALRIAPLTEIAIMVEMLGIRVNVVQAPTDRASGSLVANRRRR